MKLTHVSFRAHVKIASRIVTYRNKPQSTRAIASTLFHPVCVLIMLTYLYSEIRHQQLSVSADHINGPGGVLDRICACVRTCLHPCNDI